MKKNNKFLVLLISFYFLLLFFYTNHFPRPFDDSKNIIFYALCAAALFISFFKKSNARIPLFFQVCVRVYGIASILSLFSQPQPLGESLIEFSRVFLWFGFVFLLARKKDLNLKNILQVLACSVWLIVPYHYLSTRALIPSYFESYGFLFPIGHVTYFGDFMALIAWTAWWTLSAAGIARQASRFTNYSFYPFWALTFFMALLGLWFSGTRASILGLALALFFTAFLAVQQKILSFKKLGILTLFLCLCVMGVNALSTSFRGEATSVRLGSLLQSFKSDQVQQVSSGRWHMYRNTWRMIQEKPLSGWGLGSFRFAYYGFRNSAAVDEQANSNTFVMHPHNEILHQAVSVGLVGALAWLTFFVGIYFFGIKKLNQLEPSQKALLLLGLGGLTVSLVSWQFSTNYLFPLSRALTALFIAILFGFFICEKKSSQKISLKILYILLALVCSYAVLSHQISLYFFQRAVTPSNSEQRTSDLVLAQKMGMGSFQTESSLILENVLSGNVEAQRIEDFARIYSEMPNVLYYLAVFQLQKDQILEAKETLQHALKNDPQFKSAQALLQQIESRGY